MRHVQPKTLKAAIAFWMSSKRFAIMLIFMQLIRVRALKPVPHNPYRAGASRLVGQSVFQDWDDLLLNYQWVSVSPSLNFSLHVQEPYIYERQAVPY